MRVRSLAMQEACLQSPGSMATVIGLKEDTLQAIITSVLADGDSPSRRGRGSPSESDCPLEGERDSPSGRGDSPPRGERDVCVGNFLFPGGVVISGEVGLVKEVGRRAEVEGASVKPVRVSGAFHSQLMAPAVPKLRASLETVHLRMPAFPVYSNVTGLPYGSVEEIRTGLALQVTQPVLWDRTMLHMVGEHVDVEEEGQVKRRTSGVRLLEVGPGKQLKGILKRISRTAYRQCDNLSV